MALNRWFSLPLALLVAWGCSGERPAGIPGDLLREYRPGRALVPAYRRLALQCAGGDLPGTAPRNATDTGIVPAQTRLDRMLLLLEPAEAQRNALTAFLANQQNPGSCAYHQWLTASQFADAYANSASDVNAITSWLSGEGFSVAPIPAGRGWIEFSGTAAQVELAFGAPVHAYATADGTRFALSGRETVPGAVAPLIRGLVSLDGERSAAALTTPRPVSASPEALAVETSISHAEALTPELAAGLLHLDAVHSAGTLGTGESIAIAARSNVAAEDIAGFRAAFGLAANPVVVEVAGADPGLTRDRAAAELAASWAGAAAPGARIVVVPAADTAATDGIDLSLAAIVNQSPAHTVVVGYSACEAALSGAHLAFYAALYKQAAAEGMAVIAASGDSGAAACHAAGSNAAVTSGLAVNALASTPWNSAVGAAAFSAAGDGTLAAWSPVEAADAGYAGGGGPSKLYAAPGWQQADAGYRMVPDVSLPTAMDSALSRGLAFCFSGSTPAGGCTLVRIGGSAAGAAIFGGISALLAQQYGPQGNLAPGLYALAGRSGVFNDIAQGTTRLACAAGSPGCDASGKIGYAAATGYDLATGLGWPNAQRLVSDWISPEGSGADTIALTVSPTQSNNTYNPSAQITFTATVTSNTGGATPGGQVNFVDQTTGNNLNSTPYTLDANGMASITVQGALGSGNNNMVAHYLGDATYASGDSPVLSVSIQPSTTTTTVTPSTTTPTTNTAFNVTATLAVGAPPAGTATPTGNMKLTLDGNLYSTMPVSTSGNVTGATFSVTVTTNGQHNLQAIYVGDNNFVTSTSQSVPVNANTNTANVALAVSPTQSGNTYNPSASLTFTATVSAQGGGTTPTGSVTFVDQTTGTNLTLAPSPIIGGVASATVTGTSGGMTTNGNSIVAKYSGDTLYGAANSQVLTVNIQPSTTTTTVTPATYSPTSGTAFNVTAAVTVGTPPAGTASPTGSMKLTLDGAPYGSPQAVSTSGGNTSATFSVTVSSGGQHNLQAIYAGDNNYATSTSQAVTVNAGANNAQVTLAVSPTEPNATYNPSATITFTATVASQAGGATPTGTVNFLDQATGTNINAAPVQLNNGMASVTVTGTLPTNGNSIFAKYSGDNTYGAQSSQALTVNIQPSSTTTLVTPSTTTPGVGVAFPVTVTVTVGTPPAGTMTPTGKMTLTLDGTPYANAPVATASGTTSASFNVTLTTSGSHNLQALYAGDTNYLSSTSASVGLNAAQGATVTTLTATPTTLSPGVAETFTATIAAAGGGSGTATNPFTGTVAFYDGTVQIGSAMVSGGTATLANVNLSSTATHVITALYSGDTNWGGSTSNAITLKSVLYPVTVTLTALPTTAAPGQVVTLTATVTPSVAPAAAVEQNPTGNVVFYNGTTLLGTVALTAGPGNTSVAQLLFTTLPAGSDTITAVYVGDLFYATATSNVVTITVQDFTITPAPTNPPEDLDIVQGQAGSASFIITGLGGFNSTLSVVCAIPPQDDMTCQASPQSITPTGTATFTIQTFTTGGPFTGRNEAPQWMRAAGGTALAALLFFVLPSRRRLRIFRGRMGRMLMLLLLLGGLCGVGLGCSSISGNVNGIGGTPLGETTISISAGVNIDNTIVSHSVYLTVNVLPPGSTGTAQPVIGAK